MCRTGTGASIEAIIRRISIFIIRSEILDSDDALWRRVINQRFKRDSHVNLRSKILRGGGGGTPSVC